MTDRQTSSDRMVTSLFPDRSSAERAYSDVSARGYGQDDVNLVMSDDTRKRHFLNDGAPQTERIAVPEPGKSSPRKSVLRP